MNVAHKWLYEAKMFLKEEWKTTVTNRRSGKTKTVYPADVEISENSEKYQKIMPYLLNCENAVAKISKDGWKVRTMLGSSGFVYIMRDRQIRNLANNFNVTKPFPEWIKTQTYFVAEPPALEVPIKS